MFEEVIARDRLRDAEAVARVARLRRELRGSRRARLAGALRRLADRLAPRERPAPAPERRPVFASDRRRTIQPCEVSR